MKIILPIDSFDASWIESTTGISDAVTEGAVDLFSETPSPEYTEGDFAALTDIYPPRIYKWIDVAGSGTSDVIRPDVDVEGNRAEGKGVLGTKWQDMGVLEPWRPFDGQVDPRTGEVGDAGFGPYAGSEYSYTLLLPSQADAIGIFAAQTPSVLVEVLEPDNSVLETRHIDMTDETSAVDWYEWFFSPVEWKEEHIELNLPLFEGNKLRVTFYGPIGELVVGREYDFAVTVAGTRVSTVNYDEIDRDTFGFTVITPQGYSRKVDFSGMCDTADARRIQQFLDANRSRRMVYFADKDLTNTGTLIFAIQSRWDIRLSTNASPITIEAQGVR